MISYYRFPKFTIKPIKVYKVVMKWRDGNIYSPLFGSLLSRKNGKYNLRDIFFGYKRTQSGLYVVGDGYYHSFKYCPDAIKFLSELEMKDGLHGLYIFECKVPRFSFYYERGGVLCSNRLDIKKLQIFNSL